MDRQLLFLELNEVNFDYVREYCSQGALPHLAELIERHGISRTISEQKYEQLEPWIQWVTAHTGRTYAEHRIFRLGDIVRHDIPQIWEQLEERGLSVGAISPMNAKNRLKDPAFFVPDPWTPTKISATPLVNNLSLAISQAVNDNAQAKVTPGSFFWLLAGVLSEARLRNYVMYAKLASSAMAHPWRKAMFLDALLGDVFISATRKKRPNFATLFLNAAAHIQHHYLFSSGCYRGDNRNPTWYLKEGLDPVKEVYQLYDRIVGQIRATFPDARLMIATGLHQDPHEKLTFYWRLKNHAEFLRRIGVVFERVEPRMSRDFVIYCSSPASAETAAQRLKSAKADDGEHLFEVDNRGDDLFVMVTYPKEIMPGTVFAIGDNRYEGLHRDVVFVALKNGEHNGIGYFIDSGCNDAPSAFQLTEIPQRVFAALGLAA